jgi:hypothetical protein
MKRVVMCAGRSVIEVLYAKLCSVRFLFVLPVD